MEHSPINTLELNHLLISALTKDINNREVYMMGIQNSHDYESLYDFDIYEIDRKK